MDDSFTPRSPGGPTLCLLRRLVDAAALVGRWCCSLGGGRGLSEAEADSNDFGRFFSRKSVMRTNIIPGIRNPNADLSEASVTKLTSRTSKVKLHLKSKNNTIVNMPRSYTPQEHADVTVWESMKAGFISGGLAAIPTSMGLYAAMNFSPKFVKATNWQSRTALAIMPPLFAFAYGAIEVVVNVLRTCVCSFI